MQNCQLNILLSGSKLKKSAPCWLLLSTPFLIFNLAFLTPSLLTPHSSLAASAQTPDPRKAEADRLLQQGIQQYQTSQFEAALQSWQQALQLYRTIKNRRGEGTALGNLGLAYNTLGNYGKAIEYQEQALAILREIKDRRGEEQSLGNLGIAYSLLGNYGKAIEYQEQSLAISQEIKDHLGEGNALGNLGIAYYSLGNYGKAIEYYQKRLVIAQEIKDRRGEGQSLGNLGNAYDALGNYGKAIEYHQQSLAIAREIKDVQGEGSTLGNLGVAYSALGNYGKAIEYYQNHLAISRKIKDRESEGNALGNLGIAYQFLGNYGKAIEYYQQQGLAIAREIKDRRSEGAALGNLGSAYFSLGNYGKAIEYYQQRLAIAREIKDRQGEGSALGNLGSAYRVLGSYGKAIEYHQQALVIAREIKDRAGEGISLANLGLALFRSGKLTDAEAPLLAAIQVYESLRQGLSNPNKVNIAETQKSPYKVLQQVLIAQNKPAAALEIAERGRAQAFLEQLARRVQATEQPTLSPIKIAEIKKVAQVQNATLVEYSQVYDEQLFIWVVKPTGEVAFRQVDLKPLKQQKTSLDRLVAASRCLGSVSCETIVATNRGSRTGVGVVYNPTQADRQDLKSQPRMRYLQELHKLLIVPISDLLPTDPNAHVMLLPQGSLFLAPFAALQDPQGTYLIQQHTLLFAPAIQVLELTHKQRQQVQQAGRQQAVVVGNPKMPLELPTLPGAEKEAVAIATSFQTQAILGDRATKEAIVRQMPNARWIHLATHGILDDQQGLGSAIALAPNGTGEKTDGLLTADEILNLKLNAELVVLSACDSGGGRITGDGVIGLSRSLISAGVPSVLVSLWSVPDAPTAELMTEFYRQLKQNPDKAQALRQAMLATKAKHPNPRDWAAFTLIGEAQ